MDISNTASTATLRNANNTRRYIAVVNYTINNKSYSTNKLTSFSFVWWWRGQWGIDDFDGVDDTDEFNGTVVDDSIGSIVDPDDANSTVVDTDSSTVVDGGWDKAVDNNCDKVASDDVGDTDFDDVIADDITDGVAFDGKRFWVVECWW